MINSWPLRGTIGLVLVAVFWTLNWSLEGLRTHWGFFPLWLGYCLTVDAWTYKRSGTSLWTRSHGHYAGLFLVSAPTWWLFEAINSRTGNWIYEGRAAFSDLEYLLWASLSFSTVIPAVFGTAEWFATFRIVQALPTAGRIGMRRGMRAGLVVAGVAMLALALAWPRYFFPLVWLSLFFMVDPINDALGRRSLFRAIATGNWRPVCCAGFWMSGLRFLLGDVELPVLSEMDIQNPIRRFSSRFRDASSRIWWLRPVLVGVVCCLSSGDGIALSPRFAIVCPTGPVGSLG